MAQGHGGVAPMASRPATPVQPAPASTYGTGMPYPQQASPLAANSFSPPVGISPASSPPLAERPLGYQPMAQAPAYAPMAPVQTPAENRPPQSSYPQAPAYPAQPPEWAPGERTGQVTTMVAAPGPQEAAGERTQHRRVVRRQLQTSAAYMVVAFAIAMIVFFFGAVILLAIYFSNQ
jgi:hypothetical protein